MANRRWLETCSIKLKSYRANKFSRSEQITIGNEFSHNNGGDNAIGINEILESVGNNN